MIKGIHFDNSLRMVFTRGEGLIIGCIFFVVCLQVNGPTTGRAYYAPPPPPRRLLLDQTEKKILDTAPSPSFLTGPDNRPPPPDPALRVCEVGFLTKEINVRYLHLRL